MRKFMLFSMYCSALCYLLNSAFAVDKHEFVAKDHVDHKNIVMK